MPQAVGGGPRSVAGDSDRERVVGLLREHFAQGHLDAADLDRRVGAVLAARYADEVAAALDGLPLLAGAGQGGSGGGAAVAGRFWQRRRHAQSVRPGAGWVPTEERFRDPSTGAIMRVWTDPADGSRHYVPDGES